IEVAKACMDVAPPKRCLCIQEKAVKHQLPNAVIEGRKTLYETVMGIDRCPVTKHDALVRPARECLDDSRKRAGEVDVVGVLPSQNITCGSDEPFVQGVRLPTIGRTFPIRQSMVVLF